MKKSNSFEIKPFKIFDISQLSLGQVRETKTGSKYFSINYPTQNDWLLQTPRCKVVFKPEFSISMCVILEFEEFIKEFDDFLLENMAKQLNKNLDEIPYSPLLKIFQENSDYIYDFSEDHDDSDTHHDLIHKHSIEFIRLNVGKDTKFFEKNKDTKELEEIPQFEAVSNIKVGDEVKCLIHFKQAQIKKTRSSREFIASVQLSLKQVQITHRYYS